VRTIELTEGEYKRLSSIFERFLKGGGTYLYRGETAYIQALKHALDKAERHGVLRRQ